MSIHDKLAQAVPDGWQDSLEFDLIPRLEQARAGAFERGDKLADAFLASKERAITLLTKAPTQRLT